MATILVIHGPNLNLLGRREPDIYGHMSLSTLNKQLSVKAEQYGHMLMSFQSNAEHELIQAIHDATCNEVSFIVINPAAFTHTSVVLRDALLAVAIPFIEVHLSNPYARESFRQQSFFSDIAVGIICGLGPLGYELALDAAHNYLLKIKNTETM